MVHHKTQQSIGVADDIVAAASLSVKESNMNLLKKILLVLVLIALATLSISCQTVSGFGRDVTWTADATADVLEGN